MVQKSGEPPNMYETLKLMGYLPYQLVSRISEPSTVWIPTWIRSFDAIRKKIQNIFSQNGGEKMVI